MSEVNLFCGRLLHLQLVRRFALIIKGLTEPMKKLQILGTIVTRNPSCSLAPRALVELDKLCTLLRNARTGIRPSQLLVSLTLLVSFTAYSQ